MLEWASFGHAAFIGIGAYAVGIPYLPQHPMANLILLLRIVACFISHWRLDCRPCLRFSRASFVCAPRVFYFIMITMAFAQMIFYLFVSFEIYGGDDGLVIDSYSEMPFLKVLTNHCKLYALCYGSLVVAMLIVRTITRSQFGMVLRGAKGNDERVVTLGYNTFAYRLTAYVISGAMCGYAGALLGNFTTFISPEMMDWTRSGELMFMVILGGAATTIGPVLGSLMFIVIEEVFSTFTVYWHLPFGIMLLLIVLYVRGGLVGLVSSLQKNKGE